MLKSTEINFKIEEVKGDLKLIYNAFGTPKLYQDGNLLKKKGIFKAKYLVDADFGQDYIELKRGFSFAYSAVFRGKETQLESKLSTAEYIIGILPLILIFGGGAVGAIFGILGVNTIYGFMRNEKRLSMQIIFALAITALCYIVYFAIAFLIGLIFYR